MHLFGGAGEEEGEYTGNIWWRSGREKIICWNNEHYWGSYGSWWDITAISCSSKMFLGLAIWMSPSQGLLEATWCKYYAGIHVKFKIAKFRHMYVSVCVCDEYLNSHVSLWRCSQYTQWVLESCSANQTLERGCSFRSTDAYCQLRYCRVSKQTHGSSRYDRDVTGVTQTYWFSTEAKWDGRHCLKWHWVSSGE